MFDPVWKLALGLLTGVLFGLLLQKGRVAKFRVIVAQFLLKDWTVVKIMATAIVVGAIGIYAMLPAEAVSLHIKPLVWVGVGLGGLCFGVGMAVFGYCPGTSVAACGEGRRDAMVGVVGMLFGAGVYVSLYPQLSALAKGLGNAGKVTLPAATGTSPWLWIGALTVIGVAAALYLSRDKFRQLREGRTWKSTTAASAHGPTARK